MYNCVIHIDCFFLFSEKIYKDWIYLDKCRKEKYLNCRYCGIKCCSLEFAHYHLVNKCKQY